MCISALPLIILLFAQNKALENHKAHALICSNRNDAYIEATVRPDAEPSVGEDPSALILTCTLIIPQNASENILQDTSFGKKEFPVYIPYKRSYSY